MSANRGKILSVLVVLSGVALFMCTAAYVVEHPGRDVTTGSSEAYGFYIQGMQARAKHYSPEAVRAWKQAVTVDPGFSMAWARLASYAYSLGDEPGARNDLARAEARVSEVSPHEKILIGRIAAAIRGEQAVQESLTTELIRRYPDDNEALYLSASRLAMGGELDAALAAYRRILENDPHEGEAYNRMGYILTEMGRFHEATQAFQKYVFLYPDEANPHDSLGELYLRTGKYQAALDEFRRALALKPDFIWARDHRAATLAELGRYTEAQNEIRTVEKQIEGSMTAYTWRLESAELDLDRGEPRDALAKASALVPEHGRDELLHHLLGRAYAALGRRSAAEAELEIVTALDDEHRRDAPGDSGVAERTWAVEDLAGRVAATGGDLEGASVHLGRAATMHRWDWMRSRQSALARVQALFEGGRYQDAVDAAAGILAENPNQPLAHYWTAKALEAVHRNGDAASHWDAISCTLARADLGNRYRAEASERVGSLAQSAER